MHKEALGPPALVVFIGGPGGGFAQPGYFPWTNGMTLNDGIQMAGGLNTNYVRKLVIYQIHGMRMRVRMPITNNPVLLPFDHVISPCAFP